MSLRELKEQRLLIPEELWGDRPVTTAGGALSALGTAALGLASALMIWFGSGGPITFLGLALFLLDLVIFLYTGFAAVDRQVQQLLNLGLRGKVEGLDLASGAEPP